AQNLFNLDEEKMRNFSAGNLINGFNFMRWLESDRVEAQAHSDLFRLYLSGARIN
ncbi:hypothetical protein HZD82_25250, partial [Pantoea agglomerans]|nr:hypothetical protein [Pantoea agglomerans]